MKPPDVTILLRGSCDGRSLELTLDSVLGQTAGSFVLLAGRADLGAAGTALLASYADPRLAVMETAEACESTLAGRALMLLPAGDLLAPTHLARLLAALDAAPEAAIAACAVTEFDGLTMAPGAVPAASPAALAAAIGGGGVPACALLLRTRAVLRARTGLADVTALCRALLVQGEVAAVTARLAIRRAPLAAPRPPQAPRRPARLFGTPCLPADIEGDRPPTLHVVVDTEAEFDWDLPFAADLTAVSALAEVETAQAIFDGFGLRPVYVVDYPVATQPAAIAAIRGIADRGGCAIGAHLHPWTTPPFEAPTDRRLSFPGNLAPALEAAKLDTLLQAIETSFGVRPAFYKAGRYGLGPNTVSIIAARGARVDYSLMPQTDMRAVDGPDFGDIEPIPYRIGDTGIIALPMTRDNLGPLGQARWLRDWLDTALAKRLRVRGVLSRTGLLQRLTLTPEGLSAALQIRLLKALIARGQRIFVLHYHSPSLAVGHTPYVRTEADRLEFLARLQAVCAWFFDELGGLPGRPWDLLESKARGGSPPPGPPAF